MVEGPVLYFQALENGRATLQVQRIPSSTASSNLIFLGQQSIQECCSIVISFLLQDTEKNMQQVRDPTGWSYAVWSITG